MIFDFFDNFAGKKGVLFKFKDTGRFDIMAAKVRKHVYISGRVQGVGFRAFTTRAAHSLGVNGWVKNLSDGRVEAVFSGSKEQVEKILGQVKEGPSFAKVDDIEVMDENYKGEYSSFEVKY